ncbi:MAG: signal peptide peptidase SppA [Parabacteroides sp.]|nr:signal peptide peptidase SppA [Parabacteroides sp.]MDY4758426.1 signal peptide peptidase SppA [Parabacteroides sp.]
MKQFFKMLFASVLGVIVGVTLLVVVGVIVGAGMLAMMTTSSSSYVPQKQTILNLSLSGALKDHATESPWASIMGDDLKVFSLSEVLTAIQVAKENPNVAGIYLKAGYLSAGGASLLEIRKALIDFKQSGKFIVAYADNYTQGTYFVCATADKVFLNPQGALGIQGLALETTFYKGILKKAGVEMQIFKVGTYKGAVEPYMLDHLSEANREQMTAYLSSNWNVLRAGMAESRNLQPAVIDRFANEGLSFADPEEAVKLGLVDELRYASEVETYLKEKVGAPDEKLHFANCQQIASLKPAQNSSKQHIAVMYAEGEIVPEAADQTYSMTSFITEKMAKELIRLKEDEEVKAVVIRVNSPGGSAYVSDQIWKQVKALKAEKPVVVSMGNVAASGGYYISCAANQIVAEPNTLTGSIGVFGMFPNMTGLFEKLDVTSDVVKTHTFTDLGNIARPMTVEEKALVQGTVERNYRTFLSRCADGRNMSVEAIDAIGQGRVWTGEQALANGLVDRLGDLDTAIQVAADLADLSEYSIQTVSSSKNWWDKLLDEQLGGMRISLMQWLLGDDYAQIQLLRQVRDTQGVWARLPFDWNVQ